MFSFSKLFRRIPVGLYLREGNSAGKTGVCKFDLSGVGLRFSVLESSYDPVHHEYYLDVLDRGPFVNIKSKREYHYYPDSDRGIYKIYSTWWNVYADRVNLTPQFELLMTVFLLSPAKHEVEEYDNLYDTDKLASWLRNHFTHYNSVVNSFRYGSKEDGTLVLDSGDDDVMEDNIVYDRDPLLLEVQKKSDMPMLVSDVSHNERCFCIPVTMQDVVVFSFKTVSKDPVPFSGTREMLDSAGYFIGKIIESIDVSIPEDELRPYVQYYLDNS